MKGEFPRPMRRRIFVLFMGLLLFLCAGLEFVYPLFAGTALSAHFALYLLLIIFGLICEILMLMLYAFGAFPRTSFTVDACQICSTHGLGRRLVLPLHTVEAVEVIGGRLFLQTKRGSYQIWGLCNAEALAGYIRTSLPIRPRWSISSEQQTHLRHAEWRRRLYMLLILLSVGLTLFSTYLCVKLTNGIAIPALAERELLIYRYLTLRTVAAALLAVLFAHLYCREGMTTHYLREVNRVAVAYDARYDALMDDTLLVRFFDPGFYRVVAVKWEWEYGKEVTAAVMVILEEFSLHDGWMPTALENLDFCAGDTVDLLQIEKRVADLYPDVTLEELP